MKPIVAFFLLAGFISLQSCKSENKILWQIGNADNSSAEFSLAPNEYKRFLEKDFGWEDRFFLVGQSEIKSDFPYVLPGPSDEWGGTWSTAGWRSHSINILFGIEKLPKNGEWKLIVDLLDNNSKNPPVFKIVINGKHWKYELPEGSGKNSIDDSTSLGKEFLIEIPIDNKLIKVGGNEITLTTIQGSWVMFDQVRLEGPGNARLTDNTEVFLRSVQAANYEIETPSGKIQPLLIDIEHLSGKPKLNILLDGNEIFSETIETGRYIFEAPMPAVETSTKSKYEIRIDGNELQSGKIERNPQKIITPADYADTMMGTAHSRWMIAPGPWMPFSMVKLSPDNQNGGWQAGYDPIFETIGGFSHIHEWTMAGLSMMPTNGKLETQVGDEKKPDEGYRSRLNKETEEAPIGYYKAELTDYEITAELTATTRCSFQRYTFPKDKEGSRVLIDLQNPAEYVYQLEEVQIKKVNDYRVEGFSKQLSPNTWSGGVSQEYIVHFVIEFDQPIKNFGVWSENGIQDNTEILQLKNCKDAGAFAEFDTHENTVVQVRTGISYVSIENAALNLETEVTNLFGWNFESVRQNNLNTWNDLFGRVKISSNDRREKMRFYSNMYRALCSRNIFSDVDGKWVDADEKIRQLPDPNSPALGCDAFWNTFWNLNQFWNLVTPEWSNRWVNSQLAMYDAGGWLAKGPAGMEYIPVMVAEHEIPLIVGAYQMGIRDFNVEKAFEAVKKMQTTPGQKVGGGFAGNRDLVPYLKYHFVPMDKGRFSNSLEYSYDDWTVSQFAKALGKEADHQEFKKRGEYWRNVIDPETGYARLKTSDGKWAPDFDAYKSGANHHYVEGNAWQLTFFVPQDVPALAEMIGKDRFIERLDWGFEESNKLRFNAPNDQYWDYPVIQGNQQSMHFAFLFNWVDRPWLTQKWSRAIVDRYYGYGLANAYLGDEDQGQMSAWFIMASLGLFQTDGGCRVDPVYEIASPLYPKVEIDLGQRFARGEKFIIEAKNASRLNKFVQNATLNGQPLQSFFFPASELLKGGSLVLEMGPEPNKEWGINKGK
ncbi:MAG: GH92 family glycosyl hydrolase [Prolixibacteraceae bacterium]|nr:GH92 family glycosyl hydrolase [Prolixibacteraceae bacterium]